MAFLRMKLYSEDVVMSDYRGEEIAVVCFGDKIIRVVPDQVIRMYEIKSAFFIQAVEE